VGRERPTPRFHLRRFTGGCLVNATIAVAVPAVPASVAPAPVAASTTTASAVAATTSAVAATASTATAAAVAAATAVAASELQLHHDFRRRHEFRVRRLGLRGAGATAGVLFRDARGDVCVGSVVAARCFKAFRQWSMSYEHAVLMDSI
jgi:hypothetical protein